MNRHAVPIAIVAVALASVLSAEENMWTFNGGKASLEADGIVVEQGNRTLSIDACFVAKGWGFRTIKDAIKGVSCDDGSLRMSFSAVSPPDARWQNDLPMLIVVKGVSTGYSDGSLRLAENHRVSVEQDIIDAEQDDSLAIVPLVQSFLEFDSLGGLIVGEHLRVRQLQVKPQRGEFRSVQIESAILAGKVGRRGVRSGFPVDGNGCVHHEFVNDPETVDRSTEILLRIHCLAGRDGECRTEGEKGNA